MVTAGAVVVVLAAGGTAWGLSGDSGPRYRTALVRDAAVVQTLSATGTVSPVARTDEAFQVAGTVAKVTVKVGQKVHAGEVIARLDRSTLRTRLQQARATLASARSRMAADRSGQSGRVSAGKSPVLESSNPTPVAASPPIQLGELQSAVQDAQQATDEALASAATALQTADTACGAQTSSSITPTPDVTGSPAPSATPTGEDCTAAGAALLARQHEVSRAEQHLADSEAALTAAVNKLLASADVGSAPAAPSRDGKPTRPTSGTGATISAADIALDQAAIDQARATVAADRADLAEATLRATITGHVAAVNVSHGDQVAASSSAAAVTIIGSRQEQTTINLSATAIRRVRVGMPAHVAVDGSSASLAGRVVRINAAGVESSNGTASYPVTIALPAGTDAVNGAAASVTLVVATVDDVLTVPTSAVHHNGATAYVELLRGGKQVRRTVKVGAVGAALTEIRSGLVDGQRIVLADLDAALPSSSSTLSRGGFGGFGGGGARTFVRRFGGNGGGLPPSGPSGASFD